MQSFLAIVAKDLFEKYEGKFEKLTVIFPNKRAGLFLAQEMSKLTKKPIWMPEVITLDEFTSRNIGVRKADDLTLLIKLYKAYQEYSPIKESFDEFYHWGQMLAGDFDDIDKYLVNPSDIFRNLVAYKDIEHEFAYLDEEQVELIQQFWGCFKREQYSKEQNKFLSIWECLLPTYRRYKELLLEERYCFGGMGQRIFWERIDTIQIEGDLVFAGFNALNKCEKSIFDYYKSRGIAKFYWDYDNYYLKNEYHEAGVYLRENVQRFGNELDNSYFNNLTQSSKSIHFIAVPTIIGQAKLVSEQLKQEALQGKDASTAIVLCDEELLLPTLDSLPQLPTKVNVTMGYPAKKSSIAGLVESLFELQKLRKEEKGKLFFYYKPVSGFLNHQLVQGIYNEDCQTLLKQIQAGNLIYIEQDALQLNPLFNAVFQVPENNVVQYMLGILEKQLEVIEEKDHRYDLEKEVLFTIYTSIRKIENVFHLNHIQPEENLYLVLLEKLINDLTIPFEGEPLEGIQLMGLMESRMLDFENLYLLSANEGVLPKSGVAPSYIPQSLRAAFGMPTHQHQDALFAYYFYRLIQRAQNIHIFYSTTNKENISSEMSRFLYQLKFESGIPIKEQSMQNPISIQQLMPIEIKKEASIMKKLSRYEERTTLSPSALNTYIECPLRFYFKYIAGIKEPDEVVEQIDARILGTIFHETSEAIYTRFGKSTITQEQLNTLISNDGLIENAIKESYGKIYNEEMNKLMNSGLNSLILRVIKRYIKQLFQFDKKYAPFSIVSMENKYVTSLLVNGKKILIGGNIDRIDKVENCIRILDYKTGSDNTKFESIEALFDMDNKNRNKAAFQTLLYCLMFEHTHTGNEPLVPGIYNIKNLNDNKYDYRLQMSKNPITDYFTYKADFIDKLTALLETLFNPETPFSQTTVTDRCKYCTYNKLCR